MTAGIDAITICGPEITESDHDLLVHILTDLHEALRRLDRMGVIQARHDAMLKEYKPIIDRFKSPLASAMSRKSRTGGLAP